MTQGTIETTAVAAGPDNTLDRIGANVIRYGLVAVLLWVGLLKFTAYEAEGIQGLVANSPFFSWAYGVMSVRTFAAVLGVIEIVLGILIALRGVAPKLSALGSIGAAIMFLLTLTFLLSTPGVWQPGYGFPFLSPMPGQFLAKDLLLLGAALDRRGSAPRREARQSENSAALEDCRDEQRLTRARSRAEPLVCADRLTASRRKLKLLTGSLLKPGPSRKAQPRSSRTGSTTVMLMVSSSPRRWRAITVRLAQGQASET